MRRVQSGQVGRTHGQPAGARSRRRAVAATSPIGPTASPRASCRKPSPSGRKASSATSSSPCATGSTEKQYLHDLIATRPAQSDGQCLRPALRLGGIQHRHRPDPRSGQEYRDEFHRAGARRRHADGARAGPRRGPDPLQPSPYWGNERIWDTKANNHNAMFDKQGRVWFAASGARRGQSRLLQDAARIIPRPRCSRSIAANRQLSMLDPKTGKYTFVDTCFQTHHLQFAYDANDTLWTSGGGPVVGWLNTKMFDETGDAAKSQGWTALVLDTNGNGKRDDYVEPNQPVDPAKDKRIVAGFYAVMPNPVDGSIWGSARTFPGAVVRLAPGANPPADGARGNLQRAAAGLRRARRRHRQQGRRLGVAGERPSRQLRSPQVQRPAQRPEGDRRSLPRRLDASTNIPGPGFDGHRTRTAPSRATTPGSISTTRSASARTCRCRPAISTTA